MREPVSAIRRRYFLFCSGRTIRSSFRRRGRGTPPFVFGFGELQNSAVTADPLGSPRRLKRLIAEEKGVRVVRRLIKNSIRLLMDHISIAS